MNKTEPNTEKDPDYPELDEKGFGLFARIFLFGGMALFIIALAAKPEGDTEGYWRKLGTIGDFTAGVVGTMFALAGFIYIYLSFKKQREANEMQAEAFKRERVEERFFELIKLHRDNVSELLFSFHTYRIGTDHGFHFIEEKPEHTITHRQVFNEIKKQFFSLYDELAHSYGTRPKEDIYETEYLEKMSANGIVKERGIDLKTLAKIDLTYLIIFFGVGDDGRNTIYSLTKGRYIEGFVTEILGMAKLKPKVESNLFESWWAVWRDKNKFEIFHAIHLKQNKPEYENKILTPGYEVSGRAYKPITTYYYSNNYEKYYGGHQFRLGHYFRHLFQTVGFIHEHPDLTPVEKYDYIKHLRGQLSTDEQIVLFLNSLSQLGRVWELKDKKAQTERLEKDRLISVYHFIKNIPADNIKDEIKLSMFYPNVDYEGFNAANIKNIE